jgi:hypothetical protein
VRAGTPHRLTWQAKHHHALARHHVVQLHGLGLVGLRVEPQQRQVVPVTQRQRLALLDDRRLLELQGGGKEKW